MIVNVTKIKTEALLLLCKDLILSYNKEDIFTNIDKDLKLFVKNQIDELLVNIKKVTKEQSYYLKSQKTYHIKYILKFYTLLNNLLSKRFKPSEPFNPAMLCFALLCSWFVELGKKDIPKEYIYFMVLNYSEIYDKMLVNVSNSEFKALNIKMLDIAESVIKEYNSSF
jgi:hypothetical protein